MIGRVVSSNLSIYLSDFGVPLSTPATLSLASLPYLTSLSVVPKHPLCHSLLWRLLRYEMNYINPIRVMLLAAAASFVLLCHASSVAGSVDDGGGNNDHHPDHETNINDDDDDFFPPLIEPDDIAHFFSTYDLDGLHWALTNVFHRRSARIPQELPASTNRTTRKWRQRRELPHAIISRGGGNVYTSEYKLRHDLAQARYLMNVLADTDQGVSKYFENYVIPI